MIADIARKLKQARLATGMSTRMVEIKIPASVRVSHATIANFESGRSVPNMDVLSALADLYQRPLTWFLDRAPSLSGIRYRNLKTKVKVWQRHAFEARSQTLLEGYRRVESWLNDHLGEFPSSLDFDPHVEPARAAAMVREHFDLGEDDPVPSVVNFLEGLGVRVVEHATPLRIDAMAARLGDEQVVVLNPALSAARTRLNAGHELGHVVLKDTSQFPTEDHELSERRAFEFASHLLLTPRMLRDAFKGYSMVRLLSFKQRYGISMAAMIYRAERAEGILSKTVARNLWIEFTKRGWRQNEPGDVRDDRATRFEQLIDGAIIRQQLTWAQAAEIAQMTEADLRERVDAAKQAPPRLENEQEEQSFLRIVH
jgi:Zn-dependent peptidase ImmA (M78 family)/transcriptional regulator with XRE-family HTH domain